MRPVIAGESGPKVPESHHVLGRHLNQETYQKHEENGWRCKQGQDEHRFGKSDDQRNLLEEPRRSYASASGCPWPQSALRASRSSSTISRAGDESNAIAGRSALGFAGQRSRARSRLSEPEGACG